MRRIALILTLAIAAGLMAAPPISADASCDAVAADLPVLTDNISSEWIVDTCTARTSIRVTLSEFKGGDWERADCNGGVDNCTVLRPSVDQDCGDGTLFCAYTTIHRTEVWNQNGEPCSRLWRTKVTVRNPDGDVIGQDTSPANTC